MIHTMFKERKEGINETECQDTVGLYKSTYCKLNLLELQVDLQLPRVWEKKKNHMKLSVKTFIHYGHAEKIWCENCLLGL